MFGALISATDPISVLAVFRRLGADRRLTLIVEAESLFNDGIAVVLFSVAMAAATGGRPSIAAGVWQFFWTVAGGVALGAGIGWAASRVHFELEDHLVEITRGMATGPDGVQILIHTAWLAVVTALLFPIPVRAIRARLVP